MPCEEVGQHHNSVLGKTIRRGTEKNALKTIPENKKANKSEPLLTSPEQDVGAPGRYNYKYCRGLIQSSGIHKPLGEKLKLQITSSKEGERQQKQAPSKCKTVTPKQICFGNVHPLRVLVWKEAVYLRNMQNTFCSMVFIFKQHQVWIRNVSICCFNTQHNTVV